MSTRIPEPVVPAGLPDPAELARLATALFAALPGELAAPAGVHSASGLPSTPPAALPGLPATPPGVQAPYNLAPPGSPLASPAGLEPAVPGTPVPQGLIPGSNFAQVAPSPLPTLAHRAPALLPHATAGNGVPDSVVSLAPAYEPRFGSQALGVPDAHAAGVTQAARHPLAPDAGAGDRHGRPSPGGRGSDVDPLDALARLPFSFQPALPRVVAPAGVADAAPAAAAAVPAYYFVDAVRLPDGHLTPATPAPARSYAAAPLAGAAEPVPQ
ncbi:MAG: hypothetical protein QM581_12225, partial [Pseudomonas sp.]